jgi:hypothetical protein
MIYVPLREKKLCSLIFLNEIESRVMPETLKAYPYVPE